MIWAMSHEFIQARRNDHGVWYCPNGHNWHFPGESDEERLKRQLAAANGDKKYYRELAERRQNRLEIEKRSKAAVKGQLTKTKRRVAKGICPCCNHHFDDLKEHMESDHPDYREDQT